MKLLILLPIILTLVFFVPQISYEHQSGCHSAHSCPSDSGSYVCGDKGIDTYCPKVNDKSDNNNLNSQSKIWVDKISYLPNDVVVVNGEFNTFGSFTMLVIAPNGNLVLIKPQNIYINHDTHITDFRVGGALMKYDGIYTIEMNSSNRIIAQTSFDFKNNYVEPTINLVREKWQNARGETVFIFPLSVDILIERGYLVSKYNTMN